PPAAGNQPVDGDHLIIQVRKAGGPGAMSMMPAAVHVESNVEALLLYQTDSLEGSSGTQCGIIIQPLENRAIRITKTESEIGPRFPGCAELLEAGDVGGIMERQHLFIRRRPAVTDPHVRKFEQTIGAHQIIRQTGT